ncbi:MAG TPA: superoxide dismutase [Oculatellaceae cyanobacterium]|jgi:Fe-Mn family superoxide dismutase
MAFEQPPLPYDFKALEPHMSAKTFEFHYGKHHAAYVTNLNKLVQDTEMADKSLEEVIKASFGDSSKTGIFNNAAQVWNHTFFWNCMKPNGGGQPTGELADKINTAFGSFEKFQEEFKNAAVTQFGSGWAWLVKDGDTLKITKTPNAENPLAHGQTALLTVDVWEHAYYLDYQNRRPDFVQTVLDNLINWDFVTQNLSA